MIAFVSALRAAVLRGTLPLAIALLASCTLYAGDYYTPVPYSGALIGKDSEGATPVEKVPGKEYSHTNWFRVVHPPVGGPPAGDPNLVNVDDHNAFGVPDPLQVVSWDGLLGGPIGGNSGSVDAFDYGVSGFNFPNGQVDALASRSDFLFKQVIRNEAALLFSVTADIGAGSTVPGGPFVTGDHVHWEDPASGHGTWAAIEAAPAGPGPGAGVNHHVVEDLDALEVWGPEPPRHTNQDTPVIEGYIGGLGGPNTADADRFSLDVDAASGVSVWAYDIPTAAISPWVLHSEIVAAVEKLFLETEFGPGARFEDRDVIDVDGTMARDVGDASPTAALWDVGDELLFTIDPVDRMTIIDATGKTTDVLGIIDGGEIMHLVKTAPGVGPGTFSISFLKHGGHTWDTAFDVAGTFGYAFEDVDALEAVGTLTGDTDVPEPSSLLLLGFAVGIAGLGYRRRQC